MVVTDLLECQSVGPRRSTCDGQCVRSNFGAVVLLHGACYWICFGQDKMNHIVNKTVYGGLFVDKSYFVVDNGEDIQVSSEDWDEYEIGDKWPLEYKTTKEKKQ